MPLQKARQRKDDSYDIPAAKFQQELKKVLIINYFSLTWHVGSAVRISFFFKLNIYLLFNAMVWNVAMLLYFDIVYTTGHSESRAVLLFSFFLWAKLSNLHQNPLWEPNVIEL